MRMIILQCKPDLVPLHLEWDSTPCMEILAFANPSDFLRSFLLSSCTQSPWAPSFYNVFRVFFFLLEHSSSGVLEMVLPGLSEPNVYIFSHFWIQWYHVGICKLVGCIYIMKINKTAKILNLFFLFGEPVYQNTSALPPAPGFNSNITFPEKVFLTF